MREFLQFGILCYAIALGLMAYLGVVLMRRQVHLPLACYACYFAAQGIVMFTLLSQGNGGWYRTAYWISEYIQDALLAWIVIDVLWRWKDRVKADDYILTGVIIIFLFPVILQYRAWAPVWTRDIPVYSMLLAEAIWIHGLLLRTKEEA